MSASVELEGETAMTQPSQERRRKSLAFRPDAEALEGRVVLSWAGAPPATINLKTPLADRFNVSFPIVGGFYQNSAITRGELDLYTFKAPRTGTYTLLASRTFGSINTVEGLFDSTGKRLAFNDDTSRISTNSRISITLQAGQTYVLGITNYTRTPNGQYLVTITPPSVPRR